MKKSIACSAPYGSGGLGLHFTQLVEDARSGNHLGDYYSPRIKLNDSKGHIVTSKLTDYLRYTPFRESPGWMNYLNGELFDRAVAAAMLPTDSFQGFGGQSLHSFKRARKQGCRSLSLLAANSHVNNVHRRHKEAIREFGIESSWLNDWQRRKTLKEYEMADTIEIGSEYTRESFLEQGTPPHKLSKKVFDISPRFVPKDSEDDGIFRIVYTGSLTVMKGTPTLLEAFSRLPGKNVQLTLIGGWATRGMRRYIQSWLAKDDRISLAPGDPLPHLQKANVYVHPTYEDGFAYAPMEALACGVPVIVTEDTGMKEHINVGVNGQIVPTGDWQAILDYLLSYQHMGLKRVALGRTIV